MREDVTAWLSFFDNYDEGSRRNQRPRRVFTPTQNRVCMRPRQHGLCHPSPAERPGPHQNIHSMRARFATVRSHQGPGRLVSAVGHHATELTFHLARGARHSLK